MTDASYDFYPWLRRGISNEIPDADHLGAAPESGIAERAEISVRAEVRYKDVAGKDAPDALVIPKQVKIQGPGDIVGIKREAILRTEPPPNTSFAISGLVHVELYEEDFPWRYTPAKANG